MSGSRIDEIILSAVGARWTKVAMLIAKVAPSLNGGLPYTDEDCQIISKRIEGLVRRGRLEAQGDIKLWRFSEVRRAAES
jgi:hypothetical protein